MYPYDRDVCLRIMMVGMPRTYLTTKVVENYY
jgi:hypothetical protein